MALYLGEIVPRKASRATLIFIIIVLFYHYFAIHTKYTHKIWKKDEAREPKEAIRACV